MNNDFLKEMLVTSVSCGDDDLRDILEQNVDTVFILNQSCHDEISYLSAQLSLIDLAMMFSRNRVDEARTRANSEGLDRFNSVFESESQAQRTSENRACSFAEASSFQNFTRDSVNAMRAQSDMESNATGSTQTTRWDRSTQSASGYSNVFDFANSASTGDGAGSHTDTQLNAGRSYSKTNPGFGPNANDLDPGAVVFGGLVQGVNEAVTWLSGIISWDTIGSLIEGGNQIFEAEEPGIGVGGSGDQFINDTIDDGFVREPARLPPREPFLDCCCDILGQPLLSCGGPPGANLCNYDYIDPFPSFGRGYNAKYNLSIGIPTIATLRVDWGIGEQFRQSHVMTQGCTRTVGEGSTQNRYDQVDGSRSEGGTDTLDTSQTTRDIHAIGDSFRDSRSDTTAGSATTGDAHSESHTGSDRQSHSERRAANQGTAQSRSKGRGSGLSKSDSQTKTEVRHWSQIFKSLLDMYNRIFQQIRDYEKIRVASAGIAVGCLTTCQHSLPADPALSGDLRRRAGHLTVVH